MTKGVAISAFALATASVASANPGDPVPVGNGVTIDPIIDTRLRWEHVDLETPSQDADAITLRIRAGLEIAHRSGFSVLVEGEGLLAINEDYNSTTNGLTGFATVADPESIGLNRAQIRYARSGNSLTLGRQRINLDDQRFVGSVAWRQNEQTFDAVRGELPRLGPLAIDLTYAIAQHTVFGSEAGPRARYDGDFLFANAVLTRGPLRVRLFDYLVDYDADEPAAARFSSNSIGVRADIAQPLGGGVTLNSMVSYAQQRDTGANASNYSAPYVAASFGVGMRGWSLTARFEELGSDNGKEAFQTPLATLHAFNGWADLFLTTPRNGLRDYSIAAGYTAPGTTRVAGLAGFSVLGSWRRYEADFGGLDYGSEWNAQVRFRLGRVGVLAKYADYDADGFGRDTQKFWLQFEVSY
jgi:hypothetical protein